MRPLPLPLALLLLLCCVPIAGANTTATWLTKRDQFIGAVYGNGDGVLPTQSAPNWTLTYPSDPSPGLQGLVWDLQGKFFPINATAFFSPVTPGKKAKSAFLFHHGHSNCVCAAAEGDTPIVAAKCRPGCNSSMPSLDEIGDPGYSWWDLYNTSDFLHSLGHDVFILSMPLKGVNLGPGSNDTYLATDHEWFRQWEEQGDSPLRYFMEPTYLTVNYAKAAGYEQIYMAGLSGGGWSTTFAAAIDKRIDASFPIAGSLPCDIAQPRIMGPPAVVDGRLRRGLRTELPTKSHRPTPRPNRLCLQADEDQPASSLPGCKAGASVFVQLPAACRAPITPPSHSAHVVGSSIDTMALLSIYRAARRSTSAITRASTCWQGWSRDGSRRRFSTNTTRAASRHTIGMEN
jgi:hypothetical protein